MSVINLDLEQLQKINSEISNIDSILTSNYLPSLNTTLDNIDSKVKGDTVNSIIKQIKTQFETIKADMSNILPRLEEFLTEQIKSYTVTEEQLKEALSAVLNKMASVAEITSSDLNGGKKGINDLSPEELKPNPTPVSPISPLKPGISDPTKPNEPTAQNQQMQEMQEKINELSRQNQEMQKEMNKSDLQKGWESFTKDVSNNYDFSDKKGAVGYVTEGVSGTLRTAGDVVESLSEQVPLPFAGLGGKLVSGLIDGATNVADNVTSGIQTGGGFFIDGLQSLTGFKR